MKKIVLILALSSLTTLLKAQVETEFPSGNFEEMPTLKIKHLKGMQSLDLRYMYAHLGSAYSLNYGRLLTDEVQFHVGVTYETGKLNYSKFDYKNVNIGVSYSLFKIKQKVFINPDLSGFIGFMNAKNSDLEAEENYFNYGLSGGMNVEIYILNRVSLLVTGEEQYHFKDKFGKWHYNVGGGVRFYLN